MYVHLQPRKPVGLSGLGCGCNCGGKCSKGVDGLGLDLSTIGAGAGWMGYAVGAAALYLVFQVMSKSAPSQARSTAIRDARESMKKARAMPRW